ncbi:SAM-dependent methyltransferase [Fusibacter sp. JL298sf-3]
MKWIGIYTQKIEGLCCRQPLLAAVCRGYYRRLVQREAALGGVNSDDCVLCIGGGPVPSTAIEIARQTGAKVTVVDNDLSAVQQAACLIRGLGLESRVTVLHACGENITAAPYSVVHVAKQVSPRQQVVEAVLRTARRGTRVLVRNPKCRFKRLYAEIDERACARCTASIQASADWWSETHLLIKEEGREYEKTPCAVQHRAGGSRRTALSDGLA